MTLATLLVRLGKREAFEAYAVTQADFLRHVVAVHLDSGRRRGSSIWLHAALLSRALHPQCCPICTLVQHAVGYDVSTNRVALFVVGTRALDVVDSLPAPAWMRQLAFEETNEIFIERIAYAR